MVRSRADTSTTEYSNVMTNQDPKLMDMTTSQCLDCKGDADVGGKIFLGGGSRDINISVGSGAPSHTAGKGSLYINYDGTTTNDRLYINTDSSTTWTSVTCGA